MPACDGKHRKKNERVSGNSKHRFFSHHYFDFRQNNIATSQQNAVGSPKPVFDKLTTLVE